MSWICRVPILAVIEMQIYEFARRNGWPRASGSQIGSIADRVRRGGHNIPKEVIKRRYRAGVRNFLRLYVPHADQWLVYDNFGDDPNLVVRSMADGKLELHDPTAWRKILAAAE